MLVVSGIVRHYDPLTESENAPIEELDPLALDPNGYILCLPTRIRKDHEKGNQIIKG